MALTKQGNFKKKVTDLPDRPSPTYTASDIKAHFQTPSDELKTTVNKLIDDLEAETGASNVGAKKNDATTPTIQGALDEKETKSSVNGINQRLTATEESVSILQEDVSSLDGEVDNQGKRIDNIVASSGRSNLEIVDARYDSINEKTYSTLSDRLDDTSSKLAQISQQDAPDKGANLVGFYDRVAPHYLKNTSDILNGLPISVLRFIDRTKHGSILDGTNIDDFTINVQDAVDSVNSLDFTGCKLDILGTVVLPPKDIELKGDNAKINSQSGLPIFQQRKRGFLTKMEGLVFTGNATAFDYNSDDLSLPNHGQRYEYLISKCRFLQTGSIPAVNLYGTREGIIDSSFFEGNDGILTEFAINSVFSNLQFKNNNYIVRSKLGSEGLIISNLVALGCSYGLVGERTTGFQLLNSMIDYCDIPVLLKGVTDALISNNYVSSRTANPALKTVQYDDGFNGYKYQILGNNFRTNSDGGERAVILEDIHDGEFSHNQVSNYLGNGLEYGNLTNFDIAHNTIRHRAGGGVNAIQNLVSGDDTTVQIRFNNVTKPINRTKASLYKNSGFKTEGKGEAIIPSGSSSVVVNHGLSVIPNKLDIMLTPTTPNTQGIGYYVANITTTQFTITLTQVVTGTTAFAWKIA